MLILNCKKNNYIAGSKTIKIKQKTESKTTSHRSHQPKTETNTNQTLRVGCQSRLPNLTSFPMQKFILLQYFQDLIIQLFAQRQ